MSLWHVCIEDWANSKTFSMKGYYALFLPPGFQQVEWHRNKLESTVVMPVQRLVAVASAGLAAAASDEQKLLGGSM